jgi:hypothetical protein
MPEPLVQLIGLKQLRRDLIRLDNDYFPKAFVRAGTEVATPVAERIKAALPVLTGDLASTVRVGKIRTGATVRIGTARVPYIGPVDFGGYPGEGEEYPYISGGRYVYPTAGNLTSATVDAYQREVQKAIDQYPWEQNPKE